MEALELASVKDLKNLVEYSSGAVVSKTILKKKEGNISLFSFDEGQGLSEHTAPFDALVYLVDGEARISISGNDHMLSEGQLIIMPANEPHALFAVKQFKMMLVMIKSSN